LLQWWVDQLNLKHLRTDIPAPFQGWYDPEKYAKSQQYLRESTRFDGFQSLFSLAAVIGFLLVGGFGWVDELARSPGWGMIGTGLVFTGVLILLSSLLSLPFSAYDTFSIEQRFGFNRTTPATFFGDWIKSLVLTAILGAVLLSLILWFFASAGTWGWVIAWGAVVAFQAGLMLIAPSVILPLFNKFIPLEQGALRSAIEDYAAAQNVSLKGIYKIDGSRRSTKANAYVTGLGRWKRIALFDTLIEKHTVPELVAVLAHEVGHAKLGHLRKMLAVSILTTGVMFYLLSLFLSRPALIEALGVSPEPVGGQLPLYAGLIAFGLLAAPLQRILSMAVNALSRKHEYEADAFAAQTTGEAAAMIEALKKLSVDNLSNLTPHPAKVFLEYSHPPMVERIQAMEAGRSLRDGQGATPVV
jgi:STE24 endopeptidase